MYGTTAKYNKLQFAYDMMTPECDWGDDNDLPTVAEMVEKYRVAECNNAIEPANTIPELRHDDYKTLGSFYRLSDLIRAEII